MSVRPNNYQVHCISSSDSEDELPNRTTMAISAKIPPKHEICELSSDEEMPPLSLRINETKLMTEKAANSNDNLPNSIEILSDESNHNDFHLDDSLPDIVDKDDDFSSQSSINNIKSHTFSSTSQHAAISAEAFLNKPTCQTVNKASDKLDKKAEKQREKELKAARVEAVHATKPTECVKLITVAIDPPLLQMRETSTMLEAIQGISANVEIASQKIPNSVTWRRKLVELTDENQSFPKEIEENQVLVVIPSKTFLQLAQASQQVRCGGGAAATVEDFVSEVEMSHAGKNVTILVPGLEKCFSRIKSKAQQCFRREALGSIEMQPQPPKRARANLQETTISQIEFEEVLVDLQLRKRNCTVVRVETAADIAAYVAAVTKSIANAPYKQTSPAVQALTWYAEGDTKGTVKVALNGKGLTELWIKQIQQFNSVSADTASAIVQKFPCPKRLLDAYKQCSNAQEAQMLLSNINVRRGNGPLATTRKVGPQLSRKLYTFLTCADENVVFNQN